MAATGTFLSLLALVLIVAYVGAGLSSSYFRMDDQVGVVQITGEIYSFGDITDQLRAASDNSGVKALVLYLNSPGGAAFACMEIRRYLENMSIPNVAIMDEVAASGAYYIASAADEILAHANTITGALGVISVWEDYSKWLEKEGIKFWVWKTGDAKDLFEPWRSPTAEENESIEMELNRTYEILIEDIVSGRPNLTVDRLKEIANGSAYTGIEALGLGLVDEIGDYQSAVRKVASRAKLDSYIVRDMADDDRKVLTSLIASYLLSSVTVVFAGALVLIGITKRRIGKKGQETRVEAAHKGI